MAVSTAAARAAIIIADRFTSAVQQASIASAEARELVADELQDELASIDDPRLHRIVESFVEFLAPETSGEPTA